MKLLDIKSSSLELYLEPGMSLRHLLRAITLSVIVIPITLVAPFKSRYLSCHDCCMHAYICCYFDHSVVTKVRARTSAGFGLFSSSITYTGEGGAYS